MQQATHIYRNGTILTMDSRCSIVSCLAVSGETILAVGSEAEVAPFQGPETRIVDLGGRFMMPGFYDCHSHFMRAGMYNKYSFQSIFDNTILVFIRGMCTEKGIQIVDEKSSRRR